MIIQNIKTFSFNGMMQPLDEYRHSKNGLVIRILLNKIADDNCIIAEVPGTFKISMRRGKKEIVNKDFRDKSECLFQVTDNQEYAHILDVELFFHSGEHPDWKEQKLSIPIDIYDICANDLWVICNRTYFRLVYAGYVINEDLIYGSLAESSEIKAYINKEFVKEVKYSNDVENVKFDIEKKKLQKKPICYTPFGHNTFIGDVVNFYHDGVYHMLYMPDTHHHSNRWWCGAHHFEHMITKDFITWEDVGAIWDVTEQWQSTGTGTMFFFNGKYYVAFGLHTDRMKSKDKLIDDEIKDYFNEHGETLIISYDEIFQKGKFPIGTSYAVSDDGINFKCSDKIVNIVDNPSIYAKDGKLIMFSGGNVWESNDIDKPWSIIKKKFPPCYKESGMLNTGECPSYFEWNGYKYLIMGFTGFWRTEKNSDTFFDSAASGYDIYEGLAVPMAVKTDDNRAIMAGWLGGIGWGSAVVHRELVQFSDGTLGSRWLPELIPETKLIKKLCETETDYKVEEPKSEYYIELDVKSNCGKFAVKFMNDDNTGCELQLDFDKKTVQFADISDENKMSEAISPLYMVIDEIKNKENCGAGNDINYSNLACRGRNFSIANVNYTKDTILKIMMYYHPKMDTTVIDAEINGERTLISNRSDLLVNRIKTSSSGDVHQNEFNIYLAEIL